ncbi:hypothetical protein [Clostridium thailandense]|uniref:Uncharacterized protein n=1 Tax=Clostridium thailandense TaxID=2794346 RepID=A0A949TLG3_9CLOT|nr:hypothetical protein [Clostridium thailandense]MBV7275049.1 hypothetical protein [Clostridium thailandense]MCH5136563.1 hypothetical protein [Clostridiaceae bacterium UIB06]
MEKIYFLPQWYLEGKKNKKRKIMRSIAVLLIILDLILLEFLVISINKNEILEGEFNERVIARESKNVGKSKEPIKNSKTLDTFLTFNKSLHEELNFENLYIEGKRIELEFYPDNLNYINLIKEIEAKDEFIIKQLSNLGDQSDNKSKIIMELK